MDKQCKNCNGIVSASLGKKPRRFCSTGCARRWRYNTYYKETELARNRAWRKANPEKMRALQARWDADNVERKTRMHKNWQLKKDYGITLEEYEQYCVEVNNECAICLRDPGRWKLRFDHCHVKGHVRGLLCDNCNHGLGQFKDSPELLRAAAEYLEM